MKRKEAKKPTAARVKNKREDKEKDYTEQLEKEVRELKAINRSLMKQLKKLAKGIHKQEALEALDRIEEESSYKKPEQVEKPRCPECSRQALKEIIIAGRLFHRCDTCFYKSGVIPKK